MAAQQADPTEVTSEQLQEAGASDEYIAYFMKAIEMEEYTPSVRHGAKVAEGIVDHSGGGFHDSLWAGEARWPMRQNNPFGADDRNQQILRAAGVY